MIDGWAAGAARTSIICGKKKEKALVPQSAGASIGMTTLRYQWLLRGRLGSGALGQFKEEVRIVGIRVSQLTQVGCG